MLRWPLLPALLARVTACASPPPAHEIERLVEDTVRTAAGHEEIGNDLEAMELTRAVLLVDPGNAEAREIQDRLRPDLAEIYSHTLLGANFARRAPVERSTTAKVLFYPIDRILDLCDVITLDLHVGLGAYANFHFTRAAQVGLGVRAVGGLGWHDRRSLGVLTQADSGITLVALGAEAAAGLAAGTSGIYSYTETLAGLHRPSAKNYQEFRDFWAFGGALSLVFWGADFDFHPVQVGDFFAGWAGVDFLNDDFAGTRGLRLTRWERSNVRRLYEAYRVRELNPD